MQKCQWPPTYTLKKHPLAKRVRFRASNSYGLEITIPPRFNIKKLPAIIEENKDWIIKHLSHIKPKTCHLPDTITLQALEEKWHIFYIPASNKTRLLERPNFEIALTGTLEKNECLFLLRSWVKNHAKLKLTSAAYLISQITNLSYKTLKIRDQKTRWGSCSSDKCINLNYKLIFLPKPLMQHVIIHELCHTVHHNHSVNFWGLVASFDSAWRTHKRALKLGDDFIPGWV